MCLGMVVFFIGMSVDSGCLEIIKLLGCWDRWWGKLISLVVSVIICCISGVFGLKLCLCSVLGSGLWLF